MLSPLIIRALLAATILIACTASIAAPSTAAICGRAVETRKQQQFHPNYPGLPLGPRLATPPQLVLTESPLIELLRAHNSTRTLVIVNPHHAPLVRRHLRKSRIVMIDDPEVRDVMRILKVHVPFVDLVVGVGGGVATDVAKAVAVGKRLIVYPTLISHNCISNNRSVLGDGDRSTSYRTQSPEQVVVSLNELIEQTPRHLRLQFVRGGFGDHIAEISAAMVRDLVGGAPYHPDKIAANSATLISTINWVASLKGQPDFIDDREFFIRMTRAIHEVSANDVVAGTNAHRISIEHGFYAAILEQAEETEFIRSSHGLLVGIGTLVVARVYQEITGDARFYRQIREALEALEFPLTYTALSWHGLSPTKINEIWDDVFARYAPSRLGRIMRPARLQPLLDDVFSVGP